MMVTWEEILKTLQVEGYIQGRLEDVERHAEVMDTLVQIKGHLQEQVSHFLKYYDTVFIDNYFLH